MAITDDQLEDLKTWAGEFGRDGVLHDPSDHHIISAVFDRAEIEDMRTEDEFNQIVTPADIADQADVDDIIAAWEQGNREWLEEHEA